ncbi:hypothetical protein BOO69_07805 [Sulfitobacter alexandrii]|uniref:histidine kinase n=1 Tax=Sulfitobacter alexandrii TaxID=1917485 RepID=A0A1J0WG94_9RHOB|nr:PAS domain S-box protein [Sulfitobacter alexandrii]APE43330.1 hypothetical protein BOO69_07805 [Sulfitobacter alexandrii]
MADDDLMAQAVSGLEIAIIVLDHEGIVLQSNPAACALLGYHTGQLTGERISALLPDHDSDSLDSRIVPPATSVKLGAVSARHRDGRQIDVAVHITAWQETDAPARHTLVLREITGELARDRERSAELLRARNAIRGAHIGVFEFDVVTKQAYVSEIWRELMGLSQDEAVDVQEEWRSRVHPDDREAADEPMRRLAHNLDSRSVSEYRLYSRDRSALRWFRSDIAVAERDADGNPTRIIGAQKDVTDRKEVEIALREIAQQFQSAFDHAPIGKAILDPDGRLLRVNAAIATLLGHAVEDLEGQPFSAILHPEEIDAGMADMRGVREGRRPTQRTERRLLHRTGSVIWADVDLAAVRNDKGAVVEIILQVVDATEQHRLQELKSEFVATVSHELRTPLTSIQGALKLFNAHTADRDLSAPERRLLEIAQQNCDRLALLVSDILDFEKFSKGDLELEIEAQDLRPLVETAVVDIRHMTGPRDVTVATRLPEAALRAPVDRTRFAQLMDNLLSNAAKFSDRGSQVEVTLDRDGDRARVVVRNRGKGIPAEFREAIFTPFAQAAPSLTREHGGTGLGLSICRQIVENLGGEIGFDSTPDAFTDFWFTLPLAESGQ